MNPAVQATTATERAQSPPLAVTKQMLSKHGKLCDMNKMAILIQQDVARLEVQVQDVGSMQLCQPLQNFQGNGNQLVQAQRACTHNISLNSIQLVVKTPPTK